MLFLPLRVLQIEQTWSSQASFVSLRSSQKQALGSSLSLHLFCSQLLQNRLWVSHGQFWKFLLVLLILSRISHPSFPFDLSIFLHFYFLKGTKEISHFSFYHKGKSKFLVIGILSSKTRWKNKVFFAFKNQVQNGYEQLQYIWTKLNRNIN